MAYDAQAYEANHAFRLSLESLQEDADSAVQSLECLELKLATSALEPSQREPLKTQLSALWNRLEYRGYQGTISDSQRLQHRLSRAFYFTHSPYEPLTPNDRSLLRGLEAQAAEFGDELRAFKRTLEAQAVATSQEACGNGAQ
ncbi:MAG: hypothetical protein AAGL66_08430 [Pseudomonadota bacterium]